MDNTALVDSGLILLALIGGWFYSDFLYRTRETAFKRLPLFLMVFAGFWCLFNWLGHTIAVLIFNIKTMQVGTFVYSYHFYSLLLMGIAFAIFSGYQLNQIRLLSRGEKVYRQLKQVSFLIMALSLPIFPLNPIGLLPVISSILILVTAAATRKQWKRARTELIKVEQVVPA
ncbi:hypothetical protein H8S95_00920 [Pontibacter sp. KCTC 32443]|uniref:hypothetical protein n=1 Tax=Pontibacter TaxID=323449 RepID=UPI00164E4653|nr:MULTISPECIES: hypothetical protein [Pontibacter]MBC5772611.1 hypothetical protein [Pontibacter sp. KCTC 32443]